MQNLKRDQMISLLETVREGFLGMCDEGRPYCLPFGFVFVDGSVYISLFPKGRKWRCLQKNPRVCFSVFAWNAEGTQWSSVVVEGEMVEVTDLELIRPVVQANMLKMGFNPSGGYLEKRMSFYEQALAKPDGLRIMQIRVAHMGGKTMATVTGA